VTVRQGDTMTKIANEAGVSLDSLIKANPQVKNPDLIHPGQVLNLPAAAAAAPAGQAEAAAPAGAVAGGDEFEAEGTQKAAARRFNPPNSVLREGSAGNDVELLQRQLKAAGFDPGRADGDFGPKTKSAVQAFQRATGLETDGIVGPKTWNALSTWGADGADGQRFTPPDKVLRSGSKGPEVSLLQNELVSAGFNPGPVDGDFGPRTQQAVRAYQRAAGLEVDGIVGPKTWNSLAAGNVHAPEGPGTGEWGTTGRASDFVQAALAQDGDRYVYGAETNLNDPDPDTFDCSELVQWAAHQAGVSFVDGSSNQLQACRNAGREISVEEAIRTPGALLFRPGHVAISLGDGRTIEAKGSAYGVGIFNAAGRFTTGGLIPGMEY